MYFIDLDIDEGQKAQKEFEVEFGREAAIFSECDVRDKQKLEGRVNR